jgi:hypothetical protein
MNDVVDITYEEHILQVAFWQPFPALPEGAEPTARWCLMQGASLFRQGDVVGAERVWARIPAEDDQTQKLARPYRALALAKLGRHEEALAIAPVKGHLRAELLCATGAMKKGLALLEKELDKDESSEWRALRLATWLVRAGRPADAAEGLEKRLERLARFAPELRLAALEACLAAKKWKRAQGHLTKLEAESPWIAARVSHPKLRGSRPDVAWIPEAVRALAESPRLAALDIALLGKEQSEERRKRLVSGETAPLGVLPGDAMWAALGDGSRCHVAAVSSCRPGRTAIEDAEVWWMLDPERPDQLAFCLNPKIPSFLWPTAPPDVDAVLAALAPYRRRLVVDDPPDRQMPGHLRWFLGEPGAIDVPSPYGGDLEPMDFHTFNRVAACSPFLEPVPWASRHKSDPHVYFVNRGGFDGMHAVDDGRGMDPERIPSESYRLRHSRSVLRLELHPTSFVADVRYFPSPHEGAARAVNERFGTRFPEDLPLDVIGVLMHFDHAESVETIRSAIHEGMPDDEVWRLWRVAALLHDTTELEAWLASLPRAFDAKFDDIAWTYGRLGLLLERAIGNEALRQRIQLGPNQSALRPFFKEDEDDDDDDEA